MVPVVSRGFFVTFEGLDGSGKTTQLRRLAQWLEAAGREVTVTRQPGDTRIGERIRSLILDSRTENLAPKAELGLMFSDRAQGIAEIIEPALAQGRIVLCDRFTDSTEAYQGGGRRLGSEIVLNLHAAMCGNLQPDLTILLLPDFENSLRRARNRNTRAARQGKDENRFEKEDEHFYRRVWDAYRQIAAREPVRVIAIEGDHSIEEVHQRIVEVVQQRMRR
jgi:dTMP kinase